MINAELLLAWRCWKATFRAKQSSLEKKKVAVEVVEHTMQNR